MGVAKQQVSMAIKTGRIKFARDTRLIDFEKSKSLWEANRSDTLAGTGKANNVPNIGKLQRIRSVPKVDDIADDDDDDDDDTLNAQKIRKTKADAERVELKLAQEKGELIAKRDVLAVFFTFLVALKNSVVATPDRIIGDVQAATEQYRDDQLLLKAKIYEILRAEHNRTLNDIEELLAKAGLEVDKIAEKYL